MSRRYAIFDQAHLGPQLDVTRGGVALTTIAPGLSGSRTARLTVPIQDYDSAAEFIVYGLAGTIITGKVSIGLVTIDADLSKFVGQDKYGLGYRLSNGQAWNDNSSVATLTAGALGDVVGVRFLPETEQVEFYRNGVLAGTVALPADLQGVPLYLAASIGSDVEPGDIQVQVNSGRDWFEFDVAGHGAGWWDVPASAGTLRFADAPFVASRDDTLPYQRWEGGMTAERIDDDRGVHFWIWGSGRGQARGSAAVLTILDSEGRLDAALGGLYRDQPASIRLVDDTFDGGASVGSYIVDSITPIDPIKRRITLKGPLSAFEVPMLRRQIRPDADPDAVGRYYPMLIGPAFSCAVRLMTKANRRYAVDALGVESIGKVRDNGRALSADPVDPDFDVQAGGQIVEILNEPAGTITIDAAATGGAYTPPGAVDVLGGSSDPWIGESGPGSFPDDWELVSGIGGVPYVNSSGQLVVPHPDSAGTILLKHGTAVLEAGKRYQFSMRVEELWFHPTAPSSIAFLTNGNPWSGAFWDVQTAPLYPENGVAAGGIVYPPLPQTLRYVYAPSVSHPVYLRVRVQSTSVPLPPDYAAIIGRLVWNELAPPEDENEDEADAAVASAALPLFDMMQQGIGIRCGLSGMLWDGASFTDVDNSTGYAGQGYWASDQVVLRDYIEALLAPYLASVYEGSDGRLHAARLVDPESVPPSGPDITASDVLNDPIPEWDEMQGLTCSIGCRKNEHVFSADELADALPWAARPKLTNQYRYVRRYGGPLAPGLEHARAAPTLDSRLVVPGDAQDAIDHAGALASVPRNFFRVRVPEAGRWEPGQVARMFLPRWFKDNGGWRNVYIVRVRNSKQDFGELTVWTRGD